MQDLKIENILKVVYNKPTTKEEKELALKEYIDLIWKINDLTNQVKKLTIPVVVGQSEQLVCGCPPPQERKGRYTQLKNICAKCNKKIAN